MDKARVIVSEFNKMLKDILTGIDNETYDNGRVVCLLSYLVYFAMGIASYIIQHPWAPMDFAAGCGTMAVGFGANFHLKKSTEPTNDEQ